MFILMSGRFLNQENSFNLMNKRGQIYIIGALILSVAIFMLISQTNFVQRILFEDDFEQISKNFDVESAKLMNNLMAQNKLIDAVMGDFDSFTSKFTQYVKVENPEFEFIYVLDYQDQKIIGFHVTGEVVVGGKLLKEETSLEGYSCVSDMCFSIGGLDLGAKNVMLWPEGEPITDIEIRGTRYNLNLREGVPQIVIISREEKGNQTKVFLNEEFITGEKI